MIPNHDRGVVPYFSAILTSAFTFNEEMSKCEVVKVYDHNSQASFKYTMYVNFLEMMHKKTSHIQRVFFWTNFLARFNVFILEKISFFIFS